ncbi:MAG TPA: hypothetical protein VGQ57_12165, partial [Polyangiaceae bacterium]|nr:hypothetical protein [Polyangiaceae bacterium]
MRVLTRRVAPYLRSRRGAIAAPVLVALAVHACATRPPERTRDGLLDWLGAKVGAGAVATEVAWEPQGSAVGELVLGRGVWFLASRSPGGPRDLYRTSVRLWPNGQPLAASAPANVSDTPAADEASLLVAARRVLYATLSGGRVSGVSVLERPEGLSSSGLVARLLARVTTGLWSPLARTDLFVDVPADSAAVKLDGASLELELANPERHATYDLEKAAFPNGTGGLAHATTHPPAPDSPRITSLDLARAVLGARLTATAANLVFTRPFSKAGDAAGPGTPGRVRFGPLVSQLLKAPLGADAGAIGERAPYLERATVGADRGSDVELVALDLAQVELGVEAGSAWPKASLGPPAAGRLPNDPERLSRVVAVFNAGPEAAYERYGAMAEGRLLVAPTPGWASVVITRANRVSIGAWPFGEEVPPEVFGFTQRASMLVHAGAAVAPDDRSVRRRTALCAAGGRLIYAYARATDPGALARVLVAAGCEEAVPLAASPERLGFALASLHGPGDAHFELLDPDMD